MRSGWKIGVLALVTAAAAMASVTAPSVEAAAFTLTSPAFKNGATIPHKYVFDGMGCTGQNVSPPLAWKNVPSGTKSFALMVHDPDAPTGSGWWHWVVYNIPADVTSLPEGAGAASGALLPKGAVQGNTDFGTPSYGGPCPPPGSGKHHYDFTLYALKIEKIEVPPGASPAMIGFNINVNAIAQTRLTGLFSRSK